MSYWTDLLREEHEKAAIFEAQQDEIRKMLVGRMCPSPESIIEELTRRAIENESNRRTVYGSSSCMEE